MNTQRVVGVLLFLFALFTALMNGVDNYQKGVFNEKLFYSVVSVLIFGSTALFTVINNKFFRYAQIIIIMIVGYVALILSPYNFSYIGWMLIGLTLGCVYGFYENYRKTKYATIIILYIICLSIGMYNSIHSINFFILNLGFISLFVYIEYVIYTEFKKNKINNTRIKDISERIEKLASELEKLNHNYNSGGKNG